MNATYPRNNTVSSDPLVSIIVITYNQEPYVEAAVRSCLSQTYRNIEVIVSDDASTDGTVDIVKRLKEGDDRIQLFAAEKNRGITGNVQTALENCQGKYVAFLGGDDIIYPDKIAVQVDSMEEDIELALCFTQCHLVLGNDLTPVGVTANTTVSDVRDGYELAGTFGVEIPGPAPMVRSSMVPAGGFRFVAPVASDWLFFIETCYRHKCRLIKSPLAAYRIHSTNIGKKRYSYIRDYISSYEFIAENYRSDTRLLKRVRSGLRRYLLGTFYASVIDGRNDVAEQVTDLYREIWGHFSLYAVLQLGRKANLSAVFSKLKPVIKKLV